MKIIVLLLSVMIPILLISFALLVVRIIAAVKVSKFGGSGVGYFFLGWLYILLSNVADSWGDFNKTHSVLASFFPFIGNEIYIFIKLNKETKP